LEAEYRKRAMTGYVGKRTEDPRVIETLITAAEYAAAAIERMVRQVGDDHHALKGILEDYVNLVYALEITFIFPTLGQRERDLLASLMQVRNAISIEFKGLPQWRTREQKADHDQVMKSLKQEFVTLRAEIAASDVESQLNPVQRELLQQEFLSIPLDLDGSTTLFFRKDTLKTDRCPIAFSQTIGTRAASAWKPVAPTISGSRHRC
jgi:hypothetical protein